MTDVLKFTCPRCAHDRVHSLVGMGMMQCKNCGFKAVSTSFKLEKRPSLKWGEAREVYSEDDE